LVLVAKYSVFQSILRHRPNHQNQNHIKAKTSKPKLISKPKLSKPKPYQNQNPKTKSFGFGACLKTIVYGMNSVE
jgi:hypothetical protein